jgi:hypothetical protein
MTRTQAKFIIPVPSVDDTLLRRTVIFRRAAGMGQNGAVNRASTATDPAPTERPYRVGGGASLRQRRFDLILDEIAPPRGRPWDTLPLIAMVPQWRQDYPKNRTNDHRP